MTIYTSCKVWKVICDHIFSGSFGLSYEIMKFCFTFDDIYNTMPKICEKNESSSKDKVRLLGKQIWLLYVGYRWHSSLGQYKI